MRNNSFNRIVRHNRTTKERKTPMKILEVNHDIQKQFYQAKFGDLTFALPPVEKIAVFLVIDGTVLIRIDSSVDTYLKVGRIELNDAQKDNLVSNYLSQTGDFEQKQHPFLMDLLSYKQGIFDIESKVNELLKLIS